MRRAWARFIALVCVVASVGCINSTPTSSPTLTPTRRPPLLAPTGEVAAAVLRVVDGDTIDVAAGGTTYRVSYIGMDTPETVHPTVGVECFGYEATEFNRTLVEGKMVYLEKDVSETDRYGRLLRYVWLANGRMVNDVLVRDGYAEVATSRQMLDTWIGFLKHSDRLWQPVLACGVSVQLAMRCQHLRQAALNVTLHILTYAFHHRRLTWTAGRYHTSGSECCRPTRTG